MTGSLVSVVIPVHNGERFLAEAIDSVAEQRYPNLELIVIDDGSTDGSAVIARGRAVRYRHQPNRGVAAARNAGLGIAQGELIAFLDQDDVWLPHKLEAQVAYLAEHPGVDVVISPIEIMVERGAVPLHWFEPDRGMEVQTVVQLGAMLARRSCFDRVGSFDTRYELASDTDWILRARDAGLVLETALEICMRYRMHGQNSSRYEEPLYAEVRAAYRASVARKREARLRSTR